VPVLTCPIRGAGRPPPPSGFSGPPGRIFLKSRGARPRVSRGPADTGARAWPKASGLRARRSRDPSGRRSPRHGLLHGRALSFLPGRPLHFAGKGPKVEPFHEKKAVFRPQAPRGLKSRPSFSQGRAPARASGRLLGTRRETSGPGRQPRGWARPRRPSLPFSRSKVGRLIIPHIAARPVMQMTPSGPAELESQANCLKILKKLFKILTAGKERPLVRLLPSGALRQRPARAVPLNAPPPPLSPAGSLDAAGAFRARLPGHFPRDLPHSRREPVKTC
jgi:hypothetical protein